MSIVKVIEKSGDIDGKPIKWQVLAITGYMDNDFQTLELKLNKTEAMLARILLNSKGDAPETSTRSTTEEENNFFAKNNVSNSNSLFEDGEVED